MARSRVSPRYRLLCELLIRARQGSGMTQVDLAARLRRPQSFVSKFESGERRLDVVEFLEVAAAIGCDVNETLASLLAAEA